MSEIQNDKLKIKYLEHMLERAIDERDRINKHYWSMTILYIMLLIINFITSRG